MSLTSGLLIEDFDVGHRRQVDQFRHSNSRHSPICFIVAGIFWVGACVGIMCHGILDRNVVAVSTSDR